MAATKGSITEGRLTVSGVSDRPVTGLESYYGADALVVRVGDRIYIQDALAKVKIEIDLSQHCDGHLSDRHPGSGFVVNEVRDAEGLEMPQAVTFAAKDNEDGTFRVDSKEALWFRCTIRV
jgi:hypothetical protein